VSYLRILLLIVATSLICACDLIERVQSTFASVECKRAPATQAGIATCTRVLARLPPGRLHAKNLARRADLRLLVGQSELALEDANAAIAESPDLAAGWIMRANVMFALDRSAEAGQDIDQAVRLQPDNSYPRYLRALYLSHLGKDKLALEEINWVVEFAGTDARDLRNARVARCEIRADANVDLEAALGDCDQLQRKPGAGPRAHFSRGLVLYRLGRYQEAIVEFDPAGVHDKAHANKWYMRGMAKLALGQRADGEADMAEGRRLKPGVVERARLHGYAPPALPNASARP
jgi:tetratricopeptide (TPR) repeat protein